MQSLVDETLMQAVSRNASDVHFTVGLPPQMRIDGEWGGRGDSALSPKRPLVLAYEMMLVNAAIQNLIRKGEFQQVYTQKDVGMRTMNASLAALLRRGEISRDAALAKSPDFQELQTLMGHT